MNINNYNTVQEFVEAFRQERNLSQKALGDALGYREGSYINQIESGKKSLPLTSFSRSFARCTPNSALKNAKNYWSGIGNREKRRLKEQLL